MKMMSHMLLHVLSAAMEMEGRGSDVFVETAAYVEAEEGFRYVCLDNVSLLSLSGSLRPHRRSRCKW